MKWTKAYRKIHGKMIIEKSKEPNESLGQPHFIWGGFPSLTIKLWVEAQSLFYSNSLGKDMTVDSTYDFEKKRSEPIKYNRDLMIKTIQAMKKIQKIRARRETAFITGR